ncbi:abasic site processing protein YoqW isoform X2 [Phoenix dactylifera]|uniref:Abasic site processing protein YoqW isoform X2 n=1 Tax=Phoenix dactylifera TaxID=42345 RepID=A0A8B7D1P9_PHODC|nr:abasic site processing protein YoqW isoform X2 [Phoenix dactylifera]
MCGRARCTLNPGQVAQACRLADGGGDASSIPTLQMDRYRPSYNVSPGAYLPVVAARKEAKGSGEGREAPVIHCMKWGLVPSFTKKTEKPDHFKMFNARSESIKEKASFRRLIPTNRCLVAVEGFYEWKKDGSRKQPYYIHFKDHRPLVFAALYDSWVNSEGEILHTFTILTTRSSTALQWLHDRMPVILGNKGSIDVWLEKSTPKLEAVLGPYEDSDLVWYPVTTAVGKPSFDGPECIKEIKLKSTGENPMSKFFAKKKVDKSQSEPEHKKSSNEFPQTDAFGSVKDEPDAEETEELTKEEKNGKSDHFAPPKGETIGPDVCGIKREFEEMATNSISQTETAIVLPASPVKKGKSVKSTGDRQASLLSYFGKR